MGSVVGFALGALAAHLAAHLLASSRWTWRVPRLAIISWQGIGLALGLCAIGLPLSIGLAPYRTGTGSALRLLAADLASGRQPPGLGPINLAFVGIGLGVATVLLGATTICVVRSLRAQRRHRDLLSLVARDDPSAPGALVVDHPSAAAYCLPGLHPRVVVSAGTLSLLDRSQLAAVLSHERAHADERHDLVLLPFTALCRAVPRADWLRTAASAVALLVEMRADDKARAAHAEAPLAAALLRFAGAPDRLTPQGALGLGEGDLDVRVQRLLHPPGPARLRGALSLAGTALLLAMPISLFLA